MQEWLDLVKTDLEQYDALGSEAKRKMNQILAYGPGAFADWVGAYDGVIWDCRKLRTHGYVETQNFHAKFKTHINVEYLFSILSD